ncbi:hypothetical protein [Pararhizobium antarcticum]|uniref:Uncharacterized protein n=1 Tax=Pararhizobium antarcticum TaxID=1798805 RepID=A0A657LSA7_9HYPH|nr:hypothetical protein [Pararhizobium antarcticum]OJF94350.1 hypothetical protein AX761_18665 [Rhizobium sp. 58]OJF96929.1 hypothetical protein AX760_03510 [Pararhizobium antarcticum]
MSEQRPDQYMMIGLHKMASQFGDGLVPELYALLSRRSFHEETVANVVAFPNEQVRLPVRQPFFVAPDAADNILRFPIAAGADPARKDKR